MSDLDVKNLELLIQMYADHTEQLKEVKEDIQALMNDFTKIGVILESIVKKLDILLETRDETFKRLEDIENILNNISLRVEKQDVEISVISGVISP